ncbi:hypothetical protein ACFOOK_09585 [Micromonospora krabiensis]|uniref:Integral membrane protein n=1 Tax=Micromonospora krabiensis TaxID=307121 RepID=A0A1C3NB51_9ACTN|nr:hypothetical protein [Micromonospora krabiensis]SBV29753.1 hypothetical protein GA0070620_5334 [Micromonospora krabiensis]
MAGRVLELRVHGVSNTPPDQILGLHPEPADAPPQPRLVAGGAVTGFYRAPSGGPDDPLAVEAYSWGQLTSGARTARDVERALWTLLLPFTLANVALHARPGIPPDPDQERWASRSGITAWLIRLFCLSLTSTVVLAVTGIGVDLIGWQCVDDYCLGRIPGPWEFLAHGWWSEGARALAVGLLVPLALLAVLGLVAWRTYQYEAEMPADPSPAQVLHTPVAAPTDAEPPVAQPPEEPPPEPEPPPPDPTNPLQDPTFWWGEGQLRRAAVLHLSTGAVVAAAVPLGTVLAMDPPRGVRAAVAWPAVTVGAAVLVIAVVALSRPYLTRRAGSTPLGPWSAAVAGLAALAVLGTVALLLLPDGPAGTPLAGWRPPRGCAEDPAIPGCFADRSLPGYDWILAWLCAGQLLLLITIGGVARSGRRALAPPVAAGLLLVGGVFWIDGWLPALPPAPDPLAVWMLAVPAVTLAAVGLVLPRTPIGTGLQPLEPHTDVGWGGRGPAVIAGFGWLLCIANTTGLLYWVTDRLNNGATPSGQSTVTPPIPVMWAGLAFAVALAVLAVTLARAAVLFYRLRRREYAELVPPGHNLSLHDLRRCRDVSAFRALHRLVGEHAIRLVGCYAIAATALVTLGCAAALSHTRPHPVDAADGAAVVKVVSDVGDSLLGWLPVLVAAIGALVYRNDTVRRTVGVIWDVGTFWPRAAHPLAPPSYAERAVPELQTRIAGLLALTEHDPRRVDGIILSGHSQGTVICTAVILQLPARWRRRLWFFSYGCQLTRLYGRIFPAYFGPDRLPVLAEALTVAPRWTGWTNFWRDTDPLGWPVNAGERDLAVRDPEALHPSGGEVADPPIRNHSGYPDAPEFHQERARVARLLRRGVPLPRQPVG